MAEPVTDTAAWDGDGAGGDATEVVAEGLAWSADDDEDEPLPRQWRDVAGIAAAILAACTLVTVVLVWVHHDWQATRRPAPWDLPGAHRTPDAPAPSSSRVPDIHSLPAPTAVASPTKVEVPTTTVERKAPFHGSEAIDAAYIAALQRAGLLVIDRAAAIASGHNVCAALSEGSTEEQIVAAGLKSNSALNREGSWLAVRIAEDSYCPDRRAGD